MKKLLLLLLLLSLIAFSPPISSADDCDALCQKQDEIAKLEAQLASTKNQEKTLKSQLALIDGQTQVTTLKIEETNLKIEKLKREINDLATRIDRIGTTLDQLSEILLQRIVQTYKYSNTLSTIDMLFSSHGFSDLIQRLKYIQVAQAYDKKKLYELQATKLAYNDQKQDKQARQTEAEKLNKDLEAYKKQLADQKSAKNKLLAETQNDEDKYQQLLSQARAQLAAFSSFTNSLGGASILDNQTVCDDWGCYYNQRDSQWGNIPLNKTSYSIASDGCLVTSMAMVYTHYGHRSVTPLNINSNPDNFASYYPAFLNKIITADGATSQRIRSEIDNELSAGRPVVVGVGKGPSHFMVIISGLNGNYKINDPFYPRDQGGHNANFTDHYSLSSISEIDKVSF